MPPPAWHVAACGSWSGSWTTATYPPTSAVPTWSRFPHLRIDQSGVMNTALAFGKPIVASAVGGFAEMASDHGAALAVPPGDPHALKEALQRLLADSGERDALAARAAAAAAGPYSWAEAARQTLKLYERLLA